MTTAQLPAVRTTTSVAPIATSQETPHVEYSPYPRRLAITGTGAASSAVGTIGVYAAHLAPGIATVLLASTGGFLIVFLLTLGDWHRENQKWVYGSGPDEEPS